jgi:hypothetical protein
MVTDATVPQTPGTAAPKRSGMHLGLTTRPDTFAERFRNSSAVWLALMLYWVISDVIIALFPPSGRPTSPQGWLLHLSVTLAGLATIWCMHRTGFPAAWDTRIPARQRLLLPFLIGAITGALSIGLELSFGLLSTFQETTGLTVTIGFPQSILAYSSITSFLEFQYLLLPVPLLLWFISAVILRGRGQTPIFWVLAVLSSCIELVLQSVALLGSEGVAIEPLVLGSYLTNAFICNFSAAVLFRRYGLLAPILVRVGNYMVWHVLFGNFFL